MRMGVIYAYIGNIKVAFTVIFTCVYSYVTVCVNVLEGVHVCVFKSINIAYSTSNLCMHFNMVMCVLWKLA